VENLHKPLHAAGSASRFRREHGWGELRGEAWLAWAPTTVHPSHSPLLAPPYCRGPIPFAKLQAKRLAARRRGLGIVVPRPIEMGRPRHCAGLAWTRCWWVQYEYARCCQLWS
jgi:hypothetical protein